MHGREARFPLETSKVKPTVSPDIQTTIERLQNLREEIYPVAKANIVSSQERQKEQFRKRKGVRKINFQVGDVVLRMNMLKRSKKGHKMEDTWLGPYKILEITKNGCCKLQCLRTLSPLERKINSCQLKLYQQVCTPCLSP